MSYSLVQEQSFGSDNWCLKFQPLYNHGLLTSLSNGEVKLLDWETLNPVRNFKIDQVSINSMKLINNDYNNASLFATATLNSVKIYDIKSNDCIATITNDKKSPFLSLDSRHDMLACGTELQGVDAELYIYDVRNWSSPVKSFVDSHHDDITDIKFHPSDSNFLLSGSTDGYTNVYDLTQQEEDDALYQVINYASIHSCGWLSPRRIYTLSHMETFSISELNDRTDELREPQPLDFGDIRDQWNCDYVIDIYPGYIATGRSQEGNGNLQIIPMDGETVESSKAITIDRAHSDEVIRDVFIPRNHHNVLYSCGEDGTVKSWKSPHSQSTALEEFWDYSQRFNVFEQSQSPAPKKKHSKKKKHAIRYKPY
ncbi:hypothetical protein KAFR_0H03340 [Kazachstania africana CBS 2517]|uniref:Uncharacterized protein n=1 Tax=Kazachstania africana (strain ATCC 22294 / BCRC 22015 / CBS 2517 / CECT 1963 / NBRC 1671 / NRRL Y-8276) TaxID=1071382 RepID=H2AZI8_KAZAF|nr:hypothetical protein KAFR_0H03340 [Kazachstania africana CBS 2517]CCF59744.1 hypothetical protein KAFR_0H03340 [Kazachstania africana CBS 2517]